MLKMITRCCPVHIDAYSYICVFHPPRNTADGNLFIFLGQLAEPKNF